MSQQADKEAQCCRTNSGTAARKGDKIYNGTVQGEFAAWHGHHTNKLEKVSHWPTGWPQAGLLR